MHTLETSKANDMQTVGLITIGQAPRSDVVPDMRAIIGADVEIVEVGALTPSERHVPQTTARWRACGFDAHVAPLSPYEENDPAAVRRAADALKAGNVGLVVMDCIGFRRKTRDEVAHLVGAPTLVANL